jgi:putative peptidoglycan lipid II flippase
MFKSSVLISFLSLLATAFGFLTQLLIAQKFGTSIEVDIYIISLSTPVFIAGMVGMLFNLTITPALSKLSKARQNELILVLWSITIAVSFLIVIFSPALIDYQIYLSKGSLSSRIDEDYKDYFFASWQVCSLQICLFLATSILVGLSMPVTATAIAVLPYIGSFVVLYFSKKNSLISAIHGNEYGILIALILSLFILNTPLKKIKYNFEWSQIKSVAFKSVAVLIAMMCFSIYAIIDSFWAPRSGEGVLAIMSYTQRIIIGLGNLAIAGPSLLLMPLFSTVIAEKNFEKFKKLITNLILSSGLIIIALSILLYIYGYEIVTILFLRGEFTESSVNAVYIALKIALPGMAAMLFSVLLTRLVLCFEGSELHAAGLGVVWALVYFSMCSLFHTYGYKGFSFSYSLTWFVYLSLIIYTVKKNVNLAFK